MIRAVVRRVEETNLQFVQEVKEVDIRLELDHCSFILLTVNEIKGHVDSVAIRIVVSVNSTRIECNDALC